MEDETHPKSTTVSQILIGANGIHPNLFPPLLLMICFQSSDLNIPLHSHDRTGFKTQTESTECLGVVLSAVCLVPSSLQSPSYSPFISVMSCSLAQAEL